MYFLKYKSEPRADSPLAKKCGESLTLCWIDKTSQDDAERCAKASIARDGWRIFSLVEAFEVSLEGADPKHPSYDFYKKAEKDGEYIFHIAVRPEKHTLKKKGRTSR